MYRAPETLDEKVAAQQTKYISKQLQSVRTATMISVYRYYAVFHAIHFRKKGHIA